MGGSTSSVEIISRRLVRPESASLPDRMSSKPEVIHLTPWDLAMITVDHIQKGILLPKPQAGSAQVIDNLASSFARTLGRFYPFAGRLTALEITDGMSSPSLIISLCCNNEGAEFVHAMAPGVSVRDITTSLYTPSVVWSFFPLNRLLSVDAVMDSLPVLSAQVTELADGFFIAMSLNHGVADGTAFWRFFNTWSEINRSSSGSEGCKLSTPPPVLDRWFLDTCPVPIPLPFGKLEDMVRRPEYTPVQECFFHFSAESIKRLKTKANAEMAGTATATISSLQSLLAHLWRAVCRARELAPHLDTTYKLAIGFRGRVKGIPQEYIGNAVTLNDVKSTAGDVLEKGLGWTAWLLNRAVASFDEASVMDRLASWPQDPRLVYVLPSIWRDAATISTGSSPRFDVYGNDFGWGRPVTVRSGAGNKLDGKVTVYEGRGGAGSMALEVCLSAEALARLIADEEFMEAVSAA